MASMTAAEFRRIALSLPQASEAAHMGHPDFRVAGRIFATLGHPRTGWGMVKLTPEQQELFVRAQSAAFAPVKGGWGRGGATNVRPRASSTHDGLTGLFLRSVHGRRSRHAAVAGRGES